MKDSGKESSTQTNRIITEAGRIANSATESAKQSKVALDATIENFRLDQRAWIGPKEIIVKRYQEGESKICIKAGQPFKVQVPIVNSGKTPARKIKSIVGIMRLKSGEKPAISKDTIDKLLPANNAIMYPGMALTLDPPQNNSIPSETYVNELVTGQKTMYLLGLVTYVDVFGHNHSSKFCLFLTSDLEQFRPCNSHNDAD